MPADAFLVNPQDFEQLGTTSLWGLPIRPDERVPVGRLRIQCSGSAWSIENELENYVHNLAPRQNAASTKAAT